MTIPIETCKKIYIGNGITRDWFYDFVLPDASYMEVYLKEPEKESRRLTSGFFVDMSANKVVYPSAVGAEPLAEGWNLILRRCVPITQPVNLPNQEGRWLAKNVEAGLDRVVMMIQQLNELMSRAVVGGVDQSGGGAAYEALLVAVEEAKRARDDAAALVERFDIHAAETLLAYIAALEERILVAEGWATRSCACAASAEHWYAEINAVLKNVDPNFFNTFFILAGVADGGGGDDFEIITSDGGTASTVLFIDRANDGMSSNPDEWYVVNPTIAEALRGRSIISGVLKANGEITFVTD